MDIRWLGRATPQPPLVVHFLPKAPPEKRSLLPGDPIYMSGEWYLDRKQLAHMLDRRDDQEIVAARYWENEGTERPSVRDTRRDNYRRSWAHGFYRPSLAPFSSHPCG
ncbi:uncharacterized protein B0T15DRAFT_540841 [Chaetomium strumarium]|uniref:Uncharacterized protein n=1 Tax=Chaetomium strumarium TaxID=1170767 RepID=A0AAJ0GPB6_9PEZI|nr:hypothetical protein B0T15DRAFT_540841 [Chaetomium strumarium]